MKINCAFFQGAKVTLIFIFDTCGASLCLGVLASWTLLDSCAPMYCGPGATRPRTCRSLRREAEGGAAQARGAGGFTRTVARFGWVQRSVRLLVFACSFFSGCTPLAWAEKNVTGQIPYCLLRGRCARLSWGEALRRAMAVGSMLVPKESRMAARRMVRGKDTSGARHSRR